MTDLLARARRNAIPAAALLLVLAIAVGGGYALAASKTKTITVCADKGTGVLHLKTHGGRCKRGQTRVTWNQIGPQGPPGFTGPAGQPGAPAVSVWANVDNAGSVVSGQGLSVQHVGAGTYQVTITAPTVRSRGKRTGDQRLRHESPRRTGCGRVPGRLVPVDRPQPAVHGVHRGRRRRFLHADRPHLHGDGHLHVAGTWVEARSASGVWRSQHRSQPAC